MVGNKDMEKLKNTILGKVPLGWSVENLEDNLEKIIDYRGKTPTKAESGVVTLSAKSVKMNYIDYSNAYYVSKETYDKFMVRGFPKKGDILMTTEAPLGCIAELNKEDVCVAQRLLTLRGKKEKLLNKYLMYYLQSNIGQHELLSKASGTTVQGIKRTEFSKVNIILPPLETQEKIASILSALDDKIEINNEMNKTLEEMAQTLFKRWFIDFDFPNENGEPYRSSGGKMVDSELGEIPEGWEVTTLETKKEFGELIMGLSPKSESYNDLQQGLPLLNGAADFTKLKLSPKKYTTSPTRIAKKGDYVFCIRATIGLLSMTDKDYVIGRCVATIKDIKVEYREYIYMVLNNSFEKLKQNARGSVIQGLSKPDINNIKILFPIYSIMQNFNEYMSKIFEKIENNKKEIQSLTEIRDTLLPKLMSGEIEV